MQCSNRREQYAQVLDDAGFVEVRTELVPRPTLLQGGIHGWLVTFRGGLMDVLGIEGAAREEVFSQVAELLEPVLRTEDGAWWADYVRIRAWARRPDIPT